MIGEMAKMTMNAGFAGGSGRLGNAVLVQTENRPVLRARPEGGRVRSTKQAQGDARMARLNAS